MNSSNNRASLPPSAALLADLAALLGPAGICTDQDVLRPWLTDWRGRYHGRSRAMLSPATTAEVAAVVQRCAAAGAALVPQGGNSGMVGGATPDASGGQLLLSLRRMNQIRALDADAGVAVAEAGVILQHLHDAAATHGMRFPLTLGGKGSATIGGLVATNAGGTQVLRFGTMRALTLGVEAVLADGTVVDTLAPLAKDNRGYDLRHLLCGSEGTLAVITAASLRLVPQPAARAVGWIGAASPADALKILRAFTAASGGAMEGFELMPESAVKAVLRHQPGTRRPISAPGAWHILTEWTGDDEQALADRLIAAAAPLADAGLIADMAIAASHASADAWWGLREGISAASRAAGPALQHDISLPVALVPDFIGTSAAALAADWPGIGTMAYGHLGDGNLHYHVAPPPGGDAPGWLAAHGAAVSMAVYRHVEALGGSISAEHGIGQAKLAVLRALASPGRIAALRGVKAGLDPHGLFNPGKLVP